MVGRDLAIENSITLEYPIDQVSWRRKPRDVNGSGTKVVCCDVFKWNAGSWERKVRSKFALVVVRARASFCVAVLDSPNKQLKQATAKTLLNNNERTTANLPSVKKTKCLAG